MVEAGGSPTPGGGYAAVAAPPRSSSTLESPSLPSFSDCRPFTMGALPARRKEIFKMMLAITRPGLTPENSIWTWFEIFKIPLKKL